MGRKTNAERALEAAFKVHFNCVEIPIFDLPRIFQRARKLVQEGKTADQAISEISVEYKLPKLEATP